TTLLRRLRYAIDEDPKLSRRWMPLVFPEEQYDLDRLADLWLNCLDALGDALEQRGREAEAEGVDAIVERGRRAPAEHRDRVALEALIGWGRERNMGFVLLLDNIDLVLARLKNDHWALRDTFSHESRLMVVGGSAAAIEATYTYNEAFYDFFEIHELRGLSAEETRTLMTSLSEGTRFPQVIRQLEDDPGRLPALHVLTGGNPRTLVLLFQVLATHDVGQIRDDVERLLDQATPLYKARVEALPEQAQQVFHAVALNWDPMPAAEVAQAAGLDSTSQASAQLDRLAKEGLVEQVPYPPGSRLGYQVTERFFNIWYLMRASRRFRRRMIWLVEFLRLFYGAKELPAHARALLQRPCAKTGRGRLRHAELLMAHAQAVEDPALSSALESRAVQLLLEASQGVRQRVEEILDLQGSDAHLQPVLDRLDTIQECRDRVLGAEVDWPEGTGKSFWQLLGGSPSLTWEDRMLVAERLSQLPADELRGLIRDLEAEVVALNGALKSGVADVLREALRTGQMADLEDDAGARASAISFDCPALGEMAGAVAIGRGYARALGLPLDSRMQRIRSQTSLFWAARSAQDNVARESRAADDWRALGDFLVSDERYSDAEAAYQRSIELDSGGVSAWNSLGYLLHTRLERYSEAEAAYRKAIELAPNDHTLWNNFGTLLEEQLERFTEAEA
ncbi:MAG TPA: hypothetical protein VK689_11415, partial [Armatimonadota bacterium]|nr:hypothetical protein [Armatimonadota bacterium]